VHVSRDGPQIVVCFTVANIAGAKDLLDFSWNEKFLELGRQVMNSMGDMKIADDEDEDHGRRWLMRWAARTRRPRPSAPHTQIEAAMAHSLEKRCTPLKLEYDSCFNSWFEGYLEPAVSAAASLENRAEYSKAKAEEYERKCGKIWASYRDCVQVWLSFRVCPSIYYPHTNERMRF